MVNVRAMVTDLGEARAQVSRDLDRRRLKIYRVDFHLSAGLAGKRNDEPGNITRAGGQIENAQLVARPNPALKEIADQPIAAEVTIERPQIAQVGQELRRDRLRPIHPLRIRWIEPALQPNGCVLALVMPVRQRMAEKPAAQT